MTAEGFAARGWAVFAREAAMEPWLCAARRRAESLLRDPRLLRANLRHGRTWFVGVDVMGCDAHGAVPGGSALTGAGVSFARTQMSDNWDGDWGRGQLSVTYPGYPRRDVRESMANHRFRKFRDSGHLDGLLPIGPEKRRYFKEPHGIILGVALDPSGGGRSPLVAWNGSHERLMEMMHSALRDVRADQMSDICLTEIYAATRKSCFATCRRVEIEMEQGDVVVLHRAALHGVAPWSSPTTAPRRMVYFRPELPSIRDWLA